MELYIGKDTQIPLILEPDCVSSLYRIAESEGKQIQTLLNEILQAYITSKQETTSRKNVMTALEKSMNKHDSLYKALAK